MFSSRLSGLVLGILGLGLTQLLAAQTASDSSQADFYNLSLSELGQIQISIATGTATTIDRAPAVATVISAAEIEAMGARTLDDILMQVPGLHVGASSLSRLDAIYSIRGIHTGFNAQVLLLINGEPLQNVLNGGRPTLLRLAAANIERVEVIRGPGSAIYGADAYSGVINVITRDSLPGGDNQVGASVGSFDSREIWARSFGKWQDWNLSFGLAYQETKGDQGREIDQDLQTMLDSVFGTQASRAPDPLATGYRNLDTRLGATRGDTKVSLWHWRSDDAQVGAGGAQALDPEGTDQIRVWNFAISHDLADAHKDWLHTISANYLHYDINSLFTLFPAGSRLPIGGDGNLDFVNPIGLVNFTEGVIGNPSGTNRDSHVYWISNYSGWDQHRVRIASGYRYQELKARERKNFGPGILDGSEPEVGGTLVDVTGTPYVYVQDSSRRLYYLSVQDEWQFAPNWGLTAGVRHDRYADVGNTTNPRVALVWSTNERLTTKLLYGSAFRAPAINERLFVNNPVSLGNANLKPERIDTYEISFNYLVTHALQSNLTFFTYRARDMIEFVPDTGATTSTAQNARDQDAKGLEWEWQWKPSTQVWVSGSYSWQDAEDSDSGAAIPDAPGQLFKVNGYWEFSPKWSANIQAYRVADRARAVGDSRPAIADYNLINLTIARKQLLPDLDLAFTVRNLTDSQAKEPSGSSIPDDYPMEGRSVWLAFSYAFR